jgi:hypothetical protein
LAFPGGESAAYREFKQIEDEKAKARVEAFIEFIQREDRRGRP